MDVEERDINGGAAAFGSPTTSISPIDAGPCDAGPCDTAPTVMVVDDDRFFLRYVSHVFTAAGVEVITVEGAASVWAGLGRRRPDVLVLEMMLTGHDGLTLCRQLRATLEFARLPIIIASSLSGRVDEVVALAAGADRFVTKGRTGEALRSAAQDLFRRPSGLDRNR